MRKLGDTFTDNSLVSLQIFSRRILQLSAELQDARDAILTLCQPPRLTRRQFELVTSDEAIDDPANDPSVRFFGLDWKQVFSKCFNVSLNVQIFRTQVLDRDIDLDLVLISAILKDLASVEVDAMSHGEAVLNGRLSKSQQQLIQHEQTKFNDDVVATNKSSKLSKSKSFKDTNGQRRQQQQAQAQQRQISRYKKNKTTDLNKLASSSSIHSGMSLSSSTTVANKKNEWQEVMGETPPRRKSSFMQNVSSIFKNIR